MSAQQVVEMMQSMQQNETQTTVLTTAVKAHVGRSARIGHGHGEGVHNQSVDMSVRGEPIESSESESDRVGGRDFVDVKLSINVLFNTAHADEHDQLPCEPLTLWRSIELTITKGCAMKAAPK